MRQTRSLRLALVGLSLGLSLSFMGSTGCESTSNTDRGALTGGLIGAGTGAIAGHALGNTAAGAAIGAGVGARRGRHRQFDG